MALLNQKSKAPTFYEGWYGNCESECEDFALITGTGSSASHIHNNIQAVFTISDNAEGTLVYNGLATIPQVIAISPVKSLICGVAYRIVMKPGTGSLDIPHFTFGNIGADKSKRVADNCDANPTPTPTPTIDVGRITSCENPCTSLVESANDFSNLGDTWTNFNPLSGGVVYNDVQSEQINDWSIILTETSEISNLPAFMQNESHLLQIETRSGSSGYNAGLFMLDQNDQLETITPNSCANISFKYKFISTTSGGGDGNAYGLVAKQDNNYFAYYFGVTKETNVAIYTDKKLLEGAWLRIAGQGSSSKPDWNKPTSFGVFFANSRSGNTKSIATNFKICVYHPEIAPTPTPVIDCCDGISESVMFVNGMVQETDGVISGLAASAINGELCYPTQSGDGFGTFNCSFNLTTGTINVTIFVKSDVIQTDDNNLFRFKSSSGECLEGRLTSTTENNDFNPVQ